MKFSIHRAGYGIIILIFFILISIVAVINLLFPVQTIIHYLLYLAGFIFYFFVVRFFRYPIRSVEPDDNLIISGADGKVVVIEDVEEPEYFKSKRKQVSVFMSPTNVHVNWFPISGLVKYFKHHHGNYFVASHPKSSHLNERTSVVIGTKDGIDVMYRQIAGTVARRIISYAEEGKMIKQGDECGFIRFGSRVDIFLPMNAKVKVKIGQKVNGCETIIAELS
jgi:phosphatidylserine decarboxylase